MLEALDGVEAVIHLAGEPIFGGLPTHARLQRVRSSRIDSTHRIVDRMLERPPEPLDGERVLRAHVHVSLPRAHGPPRDGHGLDDGVRIALQNAAIHESPGIALVGVAKHVFEIPGAGLGELPFHAGRETGPASAPEAAGLDLFNDILRFHRKKFVQGRVGAVLLGDFEGVGVLDRPGRRDLVGGDVVTKRNGGIPLQVLARELTADQFRVFGQE